MPTYTNNTGSDVVFPTEQTEDGSTVVIKAGENFTTDLDIAWPKAQSNAARQAKKVAAVADKKERVIAASEES